MAFGDRFRSAQPAPTPTSATSVINTTASGSRSAPIAAADFRTTTGSFGGSGDAVWTKRRRLRSELNPPPLEGKANLKTLEVELHRQAIHCHERLQQDLDVLHEQVHAEVHAAIAQELQGVVHRIAAVQSKVQTDVFGAVSQELQSLAQRLTALQGEVADLVPIKQTVGQLCEEAQLIRLLRDQDRAETSEAILDVKTQVAALGQQLEGSLQDLSKTCGELRSGQQRADADVEVRFQDVFQKINQGTDDASNKAEALSQRLDGLDAKFQAGAEAQRRLDESLRANEAELREAVLQLQDALHAESLVGEARFRESQAAVAALEQRQTVALRDALGDFWARSDASDAASAEQFRTSADIKARVAVVERQLDARLVEVDGGLRRLSAELGVVQSGWARVVNWTAEVDVQRLEREGKYELASPAFAAAGLRKLQLQLRITPSTQKIGDVNAECARRRWCVGAFLSGPQGQVSFRFHVAGRAQDFSADFASSSEWGSPKLVVLDQLGPLLPVRLEILDVAAPLDVGLAIDWPPMLSASIRLVDAAQVASKEVAAIRSTMVRRVEWRVGRVSERIAAARAAMSAVGGDEGLEPMCSPPFAAAGFEGLQLQLYPLGWRPRGDDMCGLFLVCPQGLFVKCRAFVGDSVRSFEHQYDEREPYGRGSFCRLGDKAGDDDCVVCGVEFLEVRQEQTLQVRGGPFGNVADQLKLVSHPSLGSMDAVRELKELQGLKGRTLGRAARVLPSSSGVLLAALAPERREMLPPSLGAVAASSGVSLSPPPAFRGSAKSLPALLPAVLGAAAAGASPSGAVVSSAADMGSPWR